MKYIHKDMTSTMGLAAIRKVHGNTRFGKAKPLMGHTGPRVEHHLHKVASQAGMTEKGDD